MAELAEAGAFDGLDLPLVVGGASLAALPARPRTLVAPLGGRALPGLPAPGRFVAVKGGRIVWAGMGQWLFEGAAAVPQAGAAVTDQSDAWAGLALAGPDAPAVLARLVPLDLEAGAFPPGSAARSLLRHVMLLLVATEAGFELLVPRSCARTAVGDLASAMRSVAGRRAIAAGGERGSPEAGQTVAPNQ